MKTLQKAKAARTKNFPSSTKISRNQKDVSKESKSSNRRLLQKGCGGRAAETARTASAAGTSDAIESDAQPAAQLTELQ